MVDKGSVRVAQGVSGSVKDKGSLFRYLPGVIDSVKKILRELGISSLSSLSELRKDVRFELMSQTMPATEMTHKPSPAIHSTYENCT